MSAPATSSKSDATFWWVFLVFAGFALLFYAVQTFLVGEVNRDPRMGDRLAIRDEIQSAQTELVEKMGLADEVKRSEQFAKAAAALQSRKAAKSDVIVPGSPTHLEQLSAEGQNAAPPADGTAAPAPDGQVPSTPPPADGAPAPVAPAPTPESQAPVTPPATNSI